ncbi:MAG: MmoB/DmpM family protein [Actinomycetota bacterium]|nr:MmoB/DmpM family protein [Actinomycetota bacterium]
MSIENPVGPILQSGEIARAVAQAVEVDNAGKRVEVRDRGSYVRIEVEGGECMLRRSTIEEELGRPFRMSELELNMSSFVGQIETGTEAVRFYKGASANGSTKEATA